MTGVLERHLRYPPRCCACGSFGTDEQDNVRKVNKEFTRETVLCASCGTSFVRELPQDVDIETEIRWLQQSRMGRALLPWFA